MSMVSTFPRYSSESTLFVAAVFMLAAMLVIAAVAGASYVDAAPASALLVGP